MTTTLPPTESELRNAASIEALFQNFEKVQKLIDACYERLKSDLEDSAAAAQVRADVARIQADAVQAMASGSAPAPVSVLGDPEDEMMAELHAAKLRNIELNTLMRLMAEARMMLAEISKMRTNDEALEALMRSAIKAFVATATAPVLRSLTSIRNSAEEGTDPVVAGLNAFMKNELPALMKEAAQTSLTTTMKQAKLLS